MLHGAANLTSTELSQAVGPFKGYQENRDPFLRVMKMHRDAVEQIDSKAAKNLKDAARNLWDTVLECGRKHGFRNAQATVLAPTGTISFMMDCDTTGIEPDIALESTDILFLIRLNERDNYTTLACSSGSARPVHIGLMVLRWIEVDH